MVPYLNYFQSPSPKGALCKVWLKLSKWKRLLNIGKAFLLLPNYLPFVKDVTLDLNKLKSLHPKMKLAQWFWKRIFLNFVNIYSLFRNYFPFEMGLKLHLNNLDSLSLKTALCQVWINWPSGSVEEDIKILLM